MAHGLSCSAACGIFSDKGLNPWSSALIGGFLTTAPPGKPLNYTFNVLVTVTIIANGLYLNNSQSKEQSLLFQCHEVISVATTLPGIKFSGKCSE